MYQLNSTMPLAAGTDHGSNFQELSLKSWHTRPHRRVLFVSCQLFGDFATQNKTVTNLRCISTHAVLTNELALDICFNRRALRVDSYRQVCPGIYDVTFATALAQPNQNQTIA
jgi:hypothetical protein